MRIFLMSLILLCSMPFAQAQELASKEDKPVHVALKTNVLADAFLNANLGVEVGIAPKWTLDITGELNAWSLSHQRRWKHWTVQPEFRFWLKDQFKGHFFGVHVFGGQYNVGHLSNNISFLGTHFKSLSDHRYEGWILGAGVSYGYAWHFNKHWTLEGEIGIGYGGSHYRVYKCAGCGKRILDHKTHNYVGPTKAAINMVYTF